MKWGSHLPYQLFTVLHLWCCQQLSPPAWCLTNFCSPSHPPTELLHWGLGEGAFSSPSEFSANPLRKQVISSPNSGGSSKSGSLVAIASLLDSWVPSGRVILKVGGQATLRPCLAIPPLLSSRSMNLAVPTPGQCPQLWLVPGEGRAEPLHLFFQGCHHGQCLLMGLSHVSQTSFCWRFPPLPLRGLVTGGWMSFSWGLAAVSGALLCFCPWCSLKEDTTSSISYGSPGGDPSSLHCLYTLRYKDCISSLLLWGPPAGWWISLPQGPALATPVDGISRLFALPLSVLGLWHDGTSHRASWGGGGYLPSTSPVPQGTALCPSPFLPLILTSPSWPPTLCQLEPYPSCSHSFASLIYGIYRKLRNITVLETITKEEW